MFNLHRREPYLLPQNLHNGSPTTPNHSLVVPWFPGLCLYAVSPFSDRIYGTVTVRYGPKPYNTVKMKIRYGSGSVRETGRLYKLAWPPVLRRVPARHSKFPSQHHYIILIIRVGQNRIYTPYMTVYLMKSLQKILYIHRIYMVLASPRNEARV